MMSVPKRKALLPLAALAIGSVGVAFLVMTKPVAEREPQPNIAPLVRVLPVEPHEVDFVVALHVQDTNINQV